MIKRKWAFGLIFVNVLALLDSLYLTWHHYQMEIAKPISSSFCTINSFINCDSVALSSYARFWGLPAAGLGVFAYTFLLGLFCYLLFYKKIDVKKDFNLSFLILSVMLVFSLRQFLASLIFVKAICIMCIGLYICILLMVIFNYLLLSKIDYKEGLNKLVDILKFAKIKESLVYTSMLFFCIIISTAICLLFKTHFESEVLPQEKTVNQEKGILDIYNELPSQEIDYKNLPFKGADDAPFVFLEASDFECPFCSLRGAILMRLMSHFEGMVKIYFLNFPLDQTCNKTIKNKFHDYACLAAQYSICASNEGKFWQYHDYLFKHQKEISKDWLQNSIKHFSFNPEKFAGCLNDFAPIKLNEDLEQGYQLNITYTPTIFLNGKKISDLVQREEDIISLLESIMKASLEK